MKLVSINYLVASSKESLFRFPLTILSAFIGVCVAIYMVEMHEEITNMFPYINALLTCALGISLYFCAAVVAEKRASKLVGIIGAVATTIILALIYYSLPTVEETHNTYIPYIRYTIFSVIAHLLVSFAPFASKSERIGFWNYNKGLFIRVFISGIYSGVLYTGLAMALTALHLLFDVDLHEELYFEIYIVILGLFNTWFFVAGLPKDLNELEHIHEHPKGLKIFAQYVLLPLLLLYLIILYAYGSKILLQWDWPKGIVSYMITAVSVLGILNVLLIHPYGSLEGNSWIKKFSKGYYFVLFPLIALLFMAIWMRVEDYGVTTNRYAIIALGVWLTIVASYFSFTKGNIKFVPISLALILTLSSFGPWGMFSVAERSQVNRLEDLLVRSNLLVDGKIVNEAIWSVDSISSFSGEIESDRWKKTGVHLASKNLNKNDLVLSDSLQNEVKSILDYLDGHHGFSAIRPWFNQDIDSLLMAGNETNEAQIYMQSMGLKYQHRYSNYQSNHFDFYTVTDNVDAVSGYDYLVGGSNYYHDYHGRTESFKIDGTEYAFELKDNEFALYSELDTIDFGLSGIIDNLINEHGNSSSKVNIDAVTVQGSSSKFDMTLQFENIALYQKDSLNVQNLTCKLFLKKRE